MKEVNLVIVESPAKAKTIEKFLGKNFIVKSSFGHIRDLAKKNLGIDVENNYKPDYIVPSDKKKVVDELKKIAKSADMVWLASDEDREGEAISWHLYEVLKLSPEKTRRIVFHEITKEAILKAVENPRFIDLDLVNAQQARRILDRLVGFEISPILWKKIKPSLSAGRVQSVAVKLIVEREREISNFVSGSAYRVLGHFETIEKNAAPQKLSAELNRRIKEESEVVSMLETFNDALFHVTDIKKKPTKKSPSPPFITSTLQQEASRKLGFSVGQTMAVAQRLYEAGKITYMRTDSLNLADSALAASAEVITKMFGEKYLHTRKFKTKDKGAQEAHEAIRPSYLNQQNVEGSRQEQKLYELIWKRTIASQMSEALLEKTTINIENNKNKELFVASGEVLKFDGFLKVYIESQDDDGEEDTKTLLPALKAAQQLDMEKICAEQRFTNHPPRYTEASLVRKLEEQGIGRPSTYAPTISTIQNRGYVIKEDRDGGTRDAKEIKLISGKIKITVKKEKFGYEKSKIFPTDIGLIVNDFLEQHFTNIMDYNFTASVEEEFDNIAEGNGNWTDMLDRFYKPFHVMVTTTSEVSERSRGERTLGIDPKSGKPILVKIGRYGPIAQIGEVSEEEKPKFASLLKGQSIETISLEEALELFKLPRSIGEYEEKEVIIGVGRFGPYVRHNSKFYSLKKGIDDPMTIEIERAVELIEEKRLADKNKHIKSFEEMPGLEILNGRFGPYISYEKKNYKIPKTKVPAELTLEECKEIMKTPVKKKK